MTKKELTARGAATRQRIIDAATEEFAQHGIAGARVERIVAAAAGLVQQLTLSVVHGNDAALALYERCGFETYGAEPRALKSTTGYADEVLMVRFLHG